jgi:hypothetical protein
VCGCVNVGVCVVVCVFVWLCVLWVDVCGSVPLWVWVFVCRSVRVCGYVCVCGYECGCVWMCVDMCLVCV